MNVAQRTAGRYVVILAIVLIGLALRVYRAGIASLDGDEAYSVWIAKLSLTQMVQTTAGDVHPPLYYAILHYWIILNGDSEFTVRLLSIIFGVLAIPAIYLLGRLLYGETVGLLSALILALSTFNVGYSQEARMYSLMLFLALLSMYFFVLFLRRGNLAISASYVLVTTLLLYTHVYGLFVVLAQNIYVLTLWLLSRQATIRLTRWAILQAATLALFAPWIGVLVHQISVVENGYWIATPTLSTLTGTFVQYAATEVLLILFFALSVLAVLKHRKLTGSTSGKALLDALGNYSWEVRPFKVTTVWLLVSWLLTLNVIPFVISLVSTPIYFYDYTIAASVALYLLVAAGITNINRTSARLAVIAIVVILCAASLQTYYTTTALGIKPQSKETFSFLNENARNADAVILFPGGTLYWFDYYSSKTNVDAMPFPAMVGVSSVGEANAPSMADNIKLLQSDTNGHARVWFINAVGHGNDSLLAQSLKTLNESYKLQYSHSYRGFGVRLYEKRS